MHLRLAFATSAAVDPEILLLDEVMAAGDVSFMESARSRMNVILRQKSPHAHVESTSENSDD